MLGGGLPHILAQVSVSKDSSLKLSGVVEGYYVYDFGRPGNKVRDPFIFAHSKHNEISLNMGLVNLSYQKTDVRAELGLMAGTFPQYNQGGEEPLLQNVWQAYAGYQLRKNLWLDVGIFPSHIGAESGITADNPTLTRSLAAENSPYYLSGARLSYSSANEKWFLLGVVCNGWQNIQETLENSNKAIGFQAQFRPDSRITFNYSNFFSNELPDSDRRYRFFQDVYAQLDAGDQVSLLLLFDVGFQENDAQNGLDWWYSPTFVLHYKENDQVGMGLRIEYFSDPEYVVIPGTIVAAPFEVFSYSLNLDYEPVPQVMFRVEGRYFFGEDPVFINATNQNAAISTSLSVRF